MEENQTFTTFDSFSVWALMLGVCLLVGSIVSNAMTDQRQSRALSQAGLLAQQILSGGFKSLTSFDTRSLEKGRVPASIKKPDLIHAEGRLGMDPWGQPYQYRFMTDAKGDEVVLVISYGPNQKRETEDGEVTASGDDIAYVARR